ncbi:preprotein translocase subunit SecG [Methylomagnum ishizawai]|uniref:Protein-export membrane protein SecG n=1 Tax=Methylomagnum ishizawai TaxID=1760988 RepID=A0A1Y6CZ25_9GAMM|nr:preprotein translocase subunit SecG [Methylomagnum ishizawai]SMF95928.1 preprotein translocase subunit SecG [Methylomagnum ishizawai]
MYQVLTILHVLVAAAVIGLVMLQQGRGADAGVGFGGGSNTLFGARGAASFLSRTTAILGTIFFLTSLSLAYMAGNLDNKGHDLMDAPQTENPAQRDLPPIIEEPAKKSDVPAPTDTPQTPSVP